MKKRFNVLMALLLAVAPLTACSSGAATDTSEEESNIVTIQVNVDGLGAVALSKDGTDPEIDEEAPFSSIVENVEKGTELRITGGLRAEDWKFVKWTKDGEDFSTDQTITVVAEENTEYIAVFKPGTGYEGEPVTDIKDAKTLGDVLALPSYNSAYGNDKYVFAFELNGVVYQAIADLDEETSAKLWDIDIGAEDAKELENNLVAPLEIKEIINIENQIPDEADINALVGKTFGELSDEGWYSSGWNAEEGVVYLNYKYFSYEAGFDAPANMDDFDDEDLAKLTVKSLTYSGIGDAAYYEFY